MPTLFVVATPIGNLSDISERAKATLASVHTVLCEDTRVTGKLLFSYQIKVPMMSYHQHSGQIKTNKVIELLEEGHDLALVTDAGTPAISDPGGKLIEELLGHFGDTITITPIPGVSAVTTALSIAGVSADEFLFLGFPPHKKGRQTFFDRVAGVKSTVVLYESTHRIFKSLEDISKRTPERHLIVCRELTKMYETTYRGTASEVTQMLQSTSIKGEFVIVLGPL
ncbi:16S rRNA (cytidine(1402)-2'-O)-methyltransferase [Candidatus Uhrbacteria bacterium CG10_big_fil_rev_8_21_14_0_10_48_16]|uniref:Ribosomal RNA small subunit methyltransferase I n=1 Tax=Candidatus Uhrbacteria bacterium CG10_big_fil_rev_8_21_14_0_10_48_16 TaxID=1975038 RepID=A0A2M8LIB5_9BACT|nr:MAG: 16S rRNA (cytidine(1402)-2'-O)-methyltransferase [Candidatus Uhrbacteria bacterium CG10_big_fil_rev_8_21_14_0_10_48_16]